MLVFILSIIIVFICYAFKSDNTKDNTPKNKVSVSLNKETPVVNYKKNNSDENISESINEKLCKSIPIVPVIDENNKLTKYMGFDCKNFQKKDSITWEEAFFNSLITINAIGTPLRKIIINQLDKKLVIDNVSFFCAYNLNGDSYIENGIEVKPLPMNFEDDVYISMVEEWYEEGKSSKEVVRKGQNTKIVESQIWKALGKYSILFFKGINFIGSITWEKNTCPTAIRNTITFHKEGYKDVRIGVTEFYIYELNENGIKNIVYNGSLKNNVNTIFDNIYTIIKTVHPAGNYTQTLFMYRGNVLIHKIEYVNPCFSLDKKITPNGGLFCQVFNEKKANYENVSTLYLNANGNIDYICGEKPKYESMNDYLDSVKYTKLKFSLIDENGYINIYYHQKECLNFYLIDEYTKNADEKIIIENKFEDDNTINYLVKYKADRIKDIAFVYFTLDNRRGANLAFANGLYGHEMVNSFVAGTAIYNIPCLDYYKGLEGDFSYLNTVSQMYLQEEQRINFKEMVKLLYSKFSEPVNYTCLPEKFYENIVVADIMLDKFSDFIQAQPIEINYATKEVYSKDGTLILDYKQKKDEIKSEIIKSGRYKTRWKSELDLYKSVLKIFPDAIYQYHNNILGGQSFDVYIPSINVAFEYQGVQHYKPVDIFGGVPKFEKQKMLDEQKRKICKTNNIKLIEWKYTMPINQLNIEKCLEELEIEHNGEKYGKKKR